ncbi:anti-phage-associated DUF1156 domain-containing protein [Endozoicomonas euniceicola]|uniref:DUF1156 domain-containing protein n=1 Tax=Endozoicomonas euniceicola TaxID=1234143 RepID=A0ABY6GRJ6_9GAMM|nr:anti-phage-associated DUF1156 domain-containing protein [Endozoicomonas euniceicola]UYM15197.1 DUF1156 domain-containing protein [Endozoicomonas euniceicola]
MVEDKVFIEEQFPVSLVSKETLKEGNAKQSQTITGLGKWWGRKELVLIRASILGMLMPVSNEPHKDREIFLKIMTMDDQGLWERCKAIPAKTIFESLTEEEQELYFSVSKGNRTGWDRETSQEQRDEITRRFFYSLSYDEKLEYCHRPEQITGPSEATWAEINSHLETDAYSLQQLIEQLGQKRFGRKPRVGDAFCGGGSIPFEAARLGCDAYGSDLNPVAAALSWAGINLAESEQRAEKVVAAQKVIFEKADQQITEWGIEHNENNWRANAFLYCTEVKCPTCDVLVPLANTWVVGPTSKVIAKLELDRDANRFDIKLVQNATKDQLKEAKEAATYKGSRVYCPACNEDHSIDSIRDTKGMRLWEKSDFMPKENDLFQERLYAIRWEETYIDDKGKEKTRRHFRAPDQEDQKRENKVIELLQEFFGEWHKNGYIPSKPVPTGKETERLHKERGWTHWHHLFTPRQLLIHGTLSKLIKAQTGGEYAAMLGLAKAADWDSKLCRWGTGAARESIAQTFYNQALNPLFNFAGKALPLLRNIFEITPPVLQTETAVIEITDARQVFIENDLWITDPPYADAVNYHELTDFFLAWYDKHLGRFFPDWYTDTREALAVKGKDEGFKRSMVEIYKNLAANMPDNGLQMVQFTHQDPSVWADLGMILWAAGLQVTSAWTVSTEAAIGTREGNYVQGTVLLILRKRLNDLDAFDDELIPEIEDAVKDQLDHMTAIDDQDHPNFGDTDYQLAAYAAALRVLTQYSEIEGINIENELYREKQKGVKSQFEKLIDQAVEIACNHLVPDGFDETHWKNLSADERLYLKGLELEKHGELRAGAYQELAKGFGVREYQFMYAKTKANAVRFKTAREFGRSNLKDHGFDASIVRHALFAVHETIKQESAQQGVNYLKTELKGFWNDRKKLIEVLRFLSRLEHIDHMDHWETDAEAASTLAGALENTNG